MKEYVEVEYKVIKKEVIEIDGKLAEYIKELRTEKEKMIRGENSNWDNLLYNNNMTELVYHICNKYQAYSIDYIAFVDDNATYLYQEC